MADVADRVTFLGSGLGSARRSRGFGPIRVLLIVGVALAWATLMCSPALGARAEVRTAPHASASGRTITGPVVFYSAFPGEPNRADIAISRGLVVYADAPGVPAFADSQHGCGQESYALRLNIYIALCNLPSAAPTAVAYLSVALGDRDDSAAVSDNGGRPYPPAVVSLNAGTGNDYVHVGPQHALINLRLYGVAGDDILSGGSSNDLESGGLGNDRLYGGSGDDALYGGPGNDIFVGGLGNDRLYGSTGNDRLYAGGGRNYIDAGSGNDVILARNGQHDLIRCGFGIDHAVADPIDTLIGC